MINDIIHILEKVQNPRVDRTKVHLLADILFIAICAIIANADSYYDMQLFGETHIQWFKKYLKLPNGIPSKHTFHRVLTMIKPETMVECLREIVGVISPEGKVNHIALDGKTIRRSYDKGANKKSIHVISAWASENGLVLGQLKVDDKSNEITAIPELLDTLDIKKTTVSIDAMGCQKEIARKIKENGGDYFLAVKANQNTLYEDIRAFFEGLSEEECESYQEITSGHGRVETRKGIVWHDVDWLPQREEWPELKSIIMIENIRETDDKRTIEKRYYICSRACSASEAVQISRNHWGIENSLHWVLDVTFGEDSSRIRKGHGPENMSVLRRIAINLCKQDKKSKHSIKARRKKAAWDINYLAKVIFNNF